MRLIEFHPGEGSRFIAAVSVLAESEARLIGGSRHTVLFVFGREGKLRAHPFEVSPNHTLLAQHYVAEKFAGLDEGTLNVAHHVLATLLNREAIFPKWTPEQLDWAADWQTQIIPLQVEVADGLTDGRGAADSAVHVLANANPNAVALWRAVSGATVLSKEKTHG